MKSFDKVEGLKEAHRALQAYQILICSATNRQQQTYGRVAKIMDFGGSGVLADILGHITYWCLDEGLPILPVIVSNNQTGRPGFAPMLLNDVALGANLAKVFSFPWFRIVPPTPLELSAVYHDKYELGTSPLAILAIEKGIKDRGIPMQPDE